VAAGWRLMGRPRRTTKRGPMDSHSTCGHATPHSGSSMTCFASVYQNAQRLKVTWDAALGERLCPVLVRQPARERRAAVVAGAPRVRPALRGPYLCVCGSHDVRGAGRRGGGRAGACCTGGLLRAGAAVEQLPWRWSPRARPQQQCGQVLQAKSKPKPKPKSKSCGPRHEREAWPHGIRRPSATHPCSARACMPGRPAATAGLTQRQHEDVRAHLQRPQPGLGQRAVQQE
jgi:hypothetical protein